MNRALVAGVLLIGSSLHCVGEVAAQARDGGGELAESTGWYESRRSPRHTSYNPFERSITAASVSRLEVLWTAKVKGKIESQALPAELSLDVSPAAPVAAAALAADVSSMALARAGSPNDSAAPQAEKLPALAVLGERIWAKHKDLSSLSTSGRVLWRSGKGSDVSEAIETAPALAHGLVYTTTKKALVVLEGLDGTLVDEIRLPDILTTPLTKWWAPGVGSVFVVTKGHGKDPHRLVSFDTYAFEPLFDVALPFGGAVSDPAAANGRVFVSGASTLALDGRTGQPVWQRTVGFGEDGVVGPAVIDGRVFVRSGETQISALAEASGELLWSAPTQADPAAGFAVTFDTIFVASNDGKGPRSEVLIEGFATSTGERTLATTVPKAEIATDLVVAADVIYFGTKDGTLYAVSMESGDILYEGSFKKPISTPVVVDGRLYIADSDDTVRALGIVGE